MWADAQQAAKHRAKFGWLPLKDVAAVTKPRRETCWNLLGCSKPANRSQPPLGRSWPYCEDMWMRHCCSTSIFRLSIHTCLTCEDIARQSCGMVRRWRFLADFLRPVFSSSRVQHVSDPHLKLALGPHHVQTSSLRRLRLGEEKR